MSRYRELETSLALARLHVQTLAANYLTNPSNLGELLAACRDIRAIEDAILAVTEADPKIYGTHGRWTGALKRDPLRDPLPHPEGP